MEANIALKHDNEMTNWSPETVALGYMDPQRMASDCDLGQNGAQVTEGSPA